MAKILVRNLDDKTIERLKKRARMKGRSLQSEVKTLLEQTTQLDMESALALANRIRRKFKGHKFKDSAALIREDRDR